MNAKTASYYLTNDDIYEDDFMRSRRGNQRRKNKGKDSRARRQARFQKETGFLTAQEAQAAEQRYLDLIGA